MVPHGEPPRLLGVVGVGADGVLVFGVPFGDEDPGVAVPPGPVAEPAGGVAVPGEGVAVPAGGAVDPGVDDCPALPDPPEVLDPPAGAVPPDGAVCAKAQLAQHRTTEINVIFDADIFRGSQLFILLYPLIC